MQLTQKIISIVWALHCRADPGNIMADNQLLLNNDDVGGGEDIFVYTGGEQRVPFGVKRLRIAENVDSILARAFNECVQLIEVEGQNKLKKIEQSAFYYCPSLRRVSKMTGVIEIEKLNRWLSKVAPP